MKKIKVLNVTSTRYGIGGAEKLLLDMADKYDNARFEISYCNLFCEKDGEGAYPNELRRRGLPLFIIKGNRIKKLPQILTDLVKLLERERFDVVHLHMRQATIVGALAARLAGVTAIVTRHYTNDPSHAGRSGIGHWITQSLDIFFTKRVKQIIAVSEHVKEALVKFCVPSERIEVIHNGIAINLFNGQPPDVYPIDIPANTLLIGTVGNLTTRKGQKYLVEAFAGVLERLPNCRLVIVGEGPEFGALSARSKELRIDDRVIFTGFRDDVPALISGFDVYVQSSVFESFGIVLLEAMATRTPVVATAIGGIPEIVEDGVTGLLVPSKAPVALANAVCQILQDDDLRSMMAENGRKRVEEHFDIRDTVRKYERVYERVASAA